MSLPPDVSRSTSPDGGPPAPPPPVAPGATASGAAPGAVGAVAGSPAPGSVPLPPPPVEAWPPADATIVVQSLSKSFGSLVAVSDVTFAVRPGVTALLGPNGAGKSTLIRLICGLTAPSTGEVWVAGGDPRADRASRGRIGLVPQQDGVFERELALDVVTLAATMSHLPHPEQRARASLDLVELDPDLDRPLGTFSKGMRQRVKIAQAIVHEPQVLVLDEPLNGLDPRQRRHSIELFHQLGEQGRTVLVSSHVLEEVERFGSHVLVVAKGRLAAQGNYHAIRALMDDQPLRIRIRCERARAVAATLVTLGSISGCTIVDDSQLEVTTLDVRTLRRQIAIVC
ncbi:MAG: ABC transporter ATP-binding protein, partial [Acidimicrobiia bacterium]|nr:ABC transporter ATP-binding protein [Acidimicrobiia bacterium]